uniref:pectinesterase n=1 Tax=Setaria viridis TaxID=4556 RepID=A0A4U6ULH9_SETVI|nr:LOW QUALITY PROTEIN: hypothetical protein SEVIR_5G188400v2 [Setaria viridis]
MKPDRRTEILGSITAQDRKADDNGSGFVFLKGKVYGVGEVYLGRVSAPNSRVIFADTYLSKTVNPAGKVMLAEFNCTGPGSDAAKRVLWSRRFTMNAVQYLTVDFINGKEWLPAFYY